MTVKFDAKLTAFTDDEVLDWFCCAFYYPGFPRQEAQEGYYSLTRLFTTLGQRDFHLLTKAACALRAAAGQVPNFV